MSISAVIPVLDDADKLTGLLADLSQHELEVVVVDAGDDPGTRELVERSGGTCVTAPASRGGQLRAGVEQATGIWIWFLHADAGRLTAAARELSKVAAKSEPCWGRFDVSLAGLGIVAWLMNSRSRWTRICTGDQCMFVHRSLLKEIGGIPDQRLMEDIELSIRLKRTGARFVASRTEVEASPRRWRARGVASTVITMWWLRFKYFCGVDADTLYDQYYDA